jgi:hypothetical protein
MGAFWGQDVRMPTTVKQSSWLHSWLAGSGCLDLGRTSFVSGFRHNFGMARIAVEHEWFEYEVAVSPSGLVIF